MDFKIEGSPKTGSLILRNDMVAGSILLKSDEHYYVEIMWLGSDITFKSDSWETASAFAQGACEVLTRMNGGY